VGAGSGEFVTLARIVKPQGRRGEVAAELFTDFPERFSERRKLQLLMPSGKRRGVELEDFWAHKDRMVFKFGGVDSIAAAEELRGCEVQIPASERLDLADGSIYISDLIGCAAYERSELLGEITGVEFGAGEAPLLKIERRGHELLVPFAEAYIVRLDASGKKLELALPEGMLELDTPLKEKERQQFASGARAPQSRGAKRHG
jgi:16S rRNA processing protein RimM